MKKSIIFYTAWMLSSCSLFAQAPNESPIPGEYAGADYILADKDAKRWVIASQQAEQCIYPTLTRIQQAHFSKEDNYIHSQYVFFYPLEEIIGEQYVKMIQNDEKSMGYATYLFKKFKTEGDQKIDSMDDVTCQRLQVNARDDLAVVKGQYKSGMQDEKKNEGAQNTDGVATNQNKFFFDIIKWGSMFLL